MNTQKIAALQPLFHDMLRTQRREPHRDLVDMMEIKLRAELALASRHRYAVTVRDQDNPVKRFDQLGMVTDELLHELLPARVWGWAEQQLPANIGEEAQWLTPRVGVLVRLHAFTPQNGLLGQPVPQDTPSVYQVRQGSTEEFVVLLRGLRAWQVKRRKRARRLVTQMWAYHCRTKAVPQISELSELVVSEAGISRLSGGEGKIAA